jgi:hypothetical protein
MNLTHHLPQNKYVHLSFSLSSFIPTSSSNFDFLTRSNRVNFSKLALTKKPHTHLLSQFGSKAKPQSETGITLISDSYPLALQEVMLITHGGKRSLHLSLPLSLQAQALIAHTHPRYQVHHLLSPQRHQSNLTPYTSSLGRRYFIHIIFKVYTITLSKKSISKHSKQKQSDNFSNFKPPPKISHPTPTTQTKQVTTRSI